MNHQIMRWLIAFGVGLALAVFAYQRATDPEPTRQKALQESLVLESRVILRSYVSPGADLQLVDPLAPDRNLGKVYIWPQEADWEVSGFYRRDETDPWHPYLMRIDSSANLLSLAVKDRNERLIGLSARDPLFSALP